MPFSSARRPSPLKWVRPVPAAHFCLPSFGEVERGSLRRDSRAGTRLPRREEAPNAAFDPLGYESFDESYSILKKGGILVAYGMNLPALTKTPRRPVFPVIAKLLSKNLLFWSGKQTTFFGLRRESKNFIPDLDLLLEWLKSGKISVPIKATFKLEEIQKAHREYASSARIGSIVIEISR